MSIPPLETFPVAGDPGALEAQANNLINTSALLSGQSQQIQSASGAIVANWAGTAAGAFQTYSNTVAGDFFGASSTLSDGGQILSSYADALTGFQSRSEETHGEGQYWHDQIVAWTTTVEQTQGELQGAEQDLASAEQEHSNAMRRGGPYGAYDASAAATRMAIAQRNVGSLKTALASDQQQLANAQRMFGISQANEQSIQEEATSTGQSYIAKFASLTIATVPALNPATQTPGATPVSAPAPPAPAPTSTPATPGPGAGAFSANQLTFAQRLAQDTGLNVNVILAWMQNEQPPGSASAPNGTNNWLNIGSTDSGFIGGSNPAWANPTAAADETSTWLHGNAIYDYGAPTAGIQAILATAGQPPEAQITAIQNSGWASAGYPDLPSIYQSIAGSAPTAPAPAPAPAPTPAPTPAPAAVPAGGTASQKISAMTAMATSLIGKPYILGGGHSGFVANETTLSGFDCSGFVSAVLHAGGYLGAPQTTGTLISQPGIASGPGQYVTIWDRPFGSQAHVIINVNGNWFECGGNSAFNPSANGGVTQMTPQGAMGELAGGGFVAYHPTGL